MASYLLENPFRRGRKRRRRAARKSRSRRRARRSNPVYLAGNPSRRRRRGRRRSSSRRRGRRSNPMSLRGAAGGLVGPVVQAGVGVASAVAGEFLTAIARKRIAPLQSLNTGIAQGLVGLLGGLALRKFGGPLKKFAGTFTAANLLFALWRQPWIPSGFTVAMNAGLGDADVEYGMIGGVGDYAIGGGVGDWYTGGQYGVQPYAQ